MSKGIDFKNDLLVQSKDNRKLAVISGLFNNLHMQPRYNQKLAIYGLFRENIVNINASNTVKLGYDIENLICTYAYDNLFDFAWPLQIEVNQASNCIKQYCRSLWANNDEVTNSRAYKITKAIDVRNRFPILPTFVDLYQRDRLKRFTMNGNILQLDDWLKEDSSNKYMSHAASGAHGNRFVYKNAMQTFINNYANNINLKPSKCKAIEDSLNAFASYTCDFQDFILERIKSKGCESSQFDFLIIPQAVKHTTSEPTEYYHVLAGAEEAIWKLKNLLDINDYIVGKDYCYADVDDKINIKDQLNNMLKEMGASNIKNNRYVVVLDRRPQENLSFTDFLKVKPNIHKTSKHWKDRIYLIKPKAYNTLPAQSRLHPEAFFSASNSYLLPIFRDSHIGINNSLNGYKFALSYHILEKNNCKRYFYFNNGCVSLKTDDINLLWPQYFAKDDNGQMQQVSLALANKLKAQEFPNLDLPYFLANCRNLSVHNTINEKQLNDSILEPTLSSSNDPGKDLDDLDWLERNILQFFGKEYSKELAEKILSYVIPKDSKYDKYIPQDIGDSNQDNNQKFEELKIKEIKARRVSLFEEIKNDIHGFPSKKETNDNPGQSHIIETIWNILKRKFGYNVKQKPKIASKVQNIVLNSKKIDGFREKITNAFGKNSLRAIDRVFASEPITKLVTIKKDVKNYQEHMSFRLEQGSKIIEQIWDNLSEELDDVWAEKRLIANILRGCVKKDKYYGTTYHTFTVKRKDVTEAEKLLSHAPLISIHADYIDKEQLNLFIKKIATVFDKSYPKRFAAKLLSAVQEICTKNIDKLSNIPEHLEHYSTSDDYNIIMSPILSNLQEEFQHVWDKRFEIANLMRAVAFDIYTHPEDLKLIKFNTYDDKSKSKKTAGTGVKERVGKVEDESLTIFKAVGLKNGQPIMSYLADAYHRDRIDRHKQLFLTAANSGQTADSYAFDADRFCAGYNFTGWWLDNNGYCRFAQWRRPNIALPLMTGGQAFIKRALPRVPFNFFNTSIIHDNLNTVVNYTLSCWSLVHDVVKDMSLKTHEYNSFPCQIDFCILPQLIKKNYTESSFLEEEINKINEEQKTDMSMSTWIAYNFDNFPQYQKSIVDFEQCKIWSIGEYLAKQGYIKNKDYWTDEVQSEYSFYNQLKSMWQKARTTAEGYQRFVCIIDRRNPECIKNKNMHGKMHKYNMLQKQWKDKIYLFSPKLRNGCQQYISTEYARLPEVCLAYTKAFLLLFDRHHFALSFKSQGPQATKVHWYFNKYGQRFDLSDVAWLWKRYFMRVDGTEQELTNRNKQFLSYLQKYKKLPDKKFEEFLWGSHQIRM